MKRKKQNLFYKRNTDVRLAIIGVLVCTLVLGAAVLAWGHIQEAEADSRNNSVISKIETAIQVESSKARISDTWSRTLDDETANPEKPSVTLEVDGKTMTVYFDGDASDSYAGEAFDGYAGDTSDSYAGDTSDSYAGEGFDGGTSFSSSTTTVQDILERANITLSGQDIVSPDLSQAVSNGDIITVIRVKTENITQEETHEYETVYQDDDTLPEGETVVSQEGLNRVTNDTYLVTYHNGQEVSREYIDSEVLAEGQDEIILVGTATEPMEETESSESAAESDASSEAESVAETDAAASSEESTESSTTETGGSTDEFSYSNVITCTAYAYVAGGYGASGNPAVVGTCAVDPSVIPLGTRLYIEGYGYAIANDTGGNIVGNTLDLVMDTTAECYQWGVRTVNVYILD